MAAPQVSELILALFQSPRGIIAIGAIVISLLTFVYLFILKGDAGTKKSSPGKRKQASTKPSPPKKTPTKKASTSSKKEGGSKQPKKEELSSNKSSAKTITKQVPIADSKETKKSVKAANTVDKVKKVPAKQANSGQSKGQKDDGEWITVAKKKPRLPSNKKATDEESSPSPQTRTSARKSVTSSKANKRNN